MDVIYFVVGIVVISFGLSVYFRIKNKRDLRLRIIREFGDFKERKISIENLRYYQSKVRADVDEVTWNDLDMDKVYKGLNRCHSFIGEQYLYSELRRTDKGEEYLENLEGLMEYFDTEENRVGTQMVLEGLGRDKLSYYLPEFVRELEDYKFQWIMLYRVLSGAFVVSLLLGIVINPVFLALFACIFVMNAVIYTFEKNKYERSIELLGSITGVIRCAKVLLESDIPYNQNEKEKVTKSLKKLQSAVKQIGNMERKKASTMSGDPFAAIVDYLIGSTLWDFHMFHRILHVLINNHDAFMELYDLIGKTDMSISVLSFRKGLKEYCVPEFSGNGKIEIKDMYHPLIGNPVVNDLVLEGNFLVTGSNASGKSTYIKAIGINLILAQTINTCLGKAAVVPRANVMSSMAVRDDISTGESYYMKEINYLKRIVTEVNDDRLTVCLVDEILRGTNREERIAASVAILKHLEEKNCLVVVASHDVVISEMLGDSYKNCHFTEHMSDEDIVFDYKVKDGVSKSTNAIKLLDYIGFPGEIVEKARELVVVV